MSETLEDMVRAQGGRARLAGVERHQNPHDSHDSLPNLCRAWFSGWDAVDRGERQIAQRERRI